MDKLSVVGLDLAKNVFQVHGINTDGEVVVRKQLRRSEMRKYFAQLAPCLIGMEACGGAHFWSRELARLGHTVRMMAPAFVKPYLKSNKNDCNDAEAICEAVQRPSMRFVQPKLPEQQAIMHLHHGRQLLVRQRVALSNHIRGVLSKYGIIMPHLLKGLQFFYYSFFILIMAVVMLDEIGSAETIAIEIMKGNFIDINKIIDQTYNQQGNNE